MANLPIQIFQFQKPIQKFRSKKSLKNLFSLLSPPPPFFFQIHHHQSNSIPFNISKLSQRSPTEVFFSLARSLAISQVFENFHFSNANIHSFYLQNYQKIHFFAKILKHFIQLFPTTHFFVISQY